MRSYTKTGNGAEMFSSVPKAFFTLYRCVVAGDCADETGRPVFVLVSAEYSSDWHLRSGYDWVMSVRLDDNIPFHNIWYIM